MMMTSVGGLSLQTDQTILEMEEINTTGSFLQDSSSKGFKQPVLVGPPLRGGLELDNL